MDHQLATIRRVAEGIVTEEELIAKLKLGRPLRIKYGMDPTAPDIHLGHCVQLRLLRKLQDFGHTVVPIVGDYTARVGAPSGKSKTRPQLDGAGVDRMAQTYIDQVGRILEVNDPAKFELRKNGEWFGSMSFAETIKLCAQMTVARMIERDEFTRRYQAGEAIHIHEFLYCLMQGYDSVMVEADIEMGGTDQHFNLLVGRDLMRGAGQHPQVTLTTPIIEGTDGTQKMSKSLGNYIAVNDPPDQMFGKLMAIPDELMPKYFRLLTDVPMDEIDALCGSGDPMGTKKRLATEIVTELYDTSLAREAEAAFRNVVQKGQLPEDIPTHVVGPDPVGLIQLIAEAFSSVGSNSEARRRIKQGGVQIDGDKVTDINHTVTPQSGMVIRCGKRNYVTPEVK